MNIIGTGLSGLVGSRIVELLSPEYVFEDISRKTGTDITNEKSVFERLEKSQSDIVIHLAAKTGVDLCEDEKELGEKSESWQINVNGTKHVVAACEKLGKKLIYVSTDMVFSGDQKVGESYTEEDVPNPQNWYAYTKQEAEKVVVQSKIPSLILRIAYPYRANFEKKEYVRTFISLLKDNREISAVSDHYFTPTFIDDIAGCLQLLIIKEVTGLFHVAGKQAISPYDVAQKIAENYGYASILIKPTTREKYFKGKAIRGFNLSLNSGKIEKLGIHMSSFDEGLEKIRVQIR